MRDGAAVVYVSHAIPSEVGHGGNHRAYQILCDLEAAVGQSHVALFSVPQWRIARPPAWQFHTSRPGHLRRFASRAERWWARTAGNPYRLFSRAAFNSVVPFAPRGLLNPDFIDEYDRGLGKLAQPAVCILEQSGFSELIDVNARHGIPTVSACQNIEAFDVVDIDFASKRSVYAVTHDLANELRVLARCAERLVISRVEAGVIGGLGLECQYYPYLPVGAIRERLANIRRNRAAGCSSPGMFLVLGSPEHLPTGKSVSWLVEQAQTRGLPPDVRIIVVGKGADGLLPPGATVRGIELRGWVAQEELDALMLEAAAVLVPQRMGFGALTRLPELACAGIPVIAAQHPTFAIDPTPGLYVVASNWDDWCSALSDLRQRRVHISDDEYAAWEERQPKPLENVLGRFLR